MNFIRRIIGYFSKSSTEEESKQPLEDQFSNLQISEFSYKSLIEGLKEKKYQRIVFLTGAGISVSAGIPDFRTPGTGLYSKLQKYNLPFPEAIFDISYFNKNPEPFYTLSKEFFTTNVHPTTSHFFQRMLFDQGVLHHIFTQNIDGLELDAGVTLDKLCQAHGHFRSCHCVECGKKHDMEKMMDCIKKDEKYRCLDDKCKGLIKPDIVFFGESLPQDFFLKSKLIISADLVMIMGTSLKVFPFAAFAQSIPDSVPVVLINNENSMEKPRKNFVFLEGDIDKSVLKIVKDLGLTEAYEKIKKETMKN